MEQLIINSATDTDAAVNVAYYLLVPPDVKKVQNGAVLFSFDGIGKSKGQIPPEFIAGFNVFKDGVKLNGIKPVKLPSSGNEQSFINKEIKSGDTIVVQVVDIYGNAWPEVQEASGEKTISLNITSTYSLNKGNDLVVAASGEMRLPSKMLTEIETLDNPWFPGHDWLKVVVNTAIKDIAPVEVNINANYTVGNGQ